MRGRCQLWLYSRRIKADIFLQPLEQGGQQRPVLSRDSIGKLLLEAAVSVFNDLPHFFPSRGEEKLVLPAVFRILRSAEVAHFFQTSGSTGYAGFIQGEKTDDILLAAPWMAADIEYNQVHRTYILVWDENGVPEHPDSLTVDPQQTG